MEQIHITKPLQQLGKIIADSRNKKFNKFGATLHNLNEPSKENSWLVHYIGCLAEIGLAHWLNLEVNLKELVGGDDGKDLMYKEWIFIVKNSSYFQNPWLRVEVKNVTKLKDYDENKLIFICCGIDITNNILYLTGWVTFDELTQNKPRKLGRTNPLSYIVKPENLRDISSLKEYCGITNSVY